MVSPSVWLVRCGSTVDSCVNNDIVALQFPISDASSLSPDAILSAITDAVGAPDDKRLASELTTFAHVIQAGDLIVVPDKPRNQYLIGRVDGDYRWDEESSNHTRRIEWINTVGWDTVPVEFKTITSYQRSVIPVNNTSLIAACVEASQSPKSKSDLLSIKPATPKRASTPRARKPAAPPKPAKYDPEKKEILCPGCGLKKHPRQFSQGSEYCVDCE